MKSLRVLLNRFLIFVTSLFPNNNSPSPEEDSLSPEEPVPKWEPRIEYRTTTMQRRRTVRPDTIVIHAAGLYIRDDNNREWFGPDYLSLVNASYHDMVVPDGTIIRSVPWEKQAWHAGKSRFDGKDHVNKFSLGFCMLIDHREAGLGWNNFLQALRQPDMFTEEHYNSLAHLCGQAMKTYPGIRMKRIVGHSVVSNKDVRPDPKPDPGAGFDMQKLKSKILRVLDE